MQIVFRCNIQADDRDVLSSVLKAISDEVAGKDVDEGETYHYAYTWFIDEEDEEDDDLEEED